MTEPRTFAGRKLLSFRGNHADWTEARWVEAIRAIEAEAHHMALGEATVLAEAAAGPREEHCCNDPEHMSAEYRASLDAEAAAGPRDDGLREAVVAFLDVWDNGPKGARPAAVAGLAAVIGDGRYEP